MLSFSGYFEGIRLLLLGQMIPGDGILPPSRRIHADPAGVNLLELLVMGTRKLPAMLRGDYAAAYAPLRQGIPRIKIALGPHVYDQADRLPGAGSNGAELDIVSGRSSPSLPHAITASRPRPLFFRMPGFENKQMYWAAKEPFP